MQFIRRRLDFTNNNTHTKFYETMIYDLNKENDIYIFDQQIKWLRENKQVCEILQVKKKRTITQNKALHLWFNHISDALNDAGETFHYFGISGKEFEMRFTESIVKDFVIKPIMKTLFKVDTTTKLDTEKINELIDVINKFFSAKGVYLPFPSIESLIDKSN